MIGFSPQDKSVEKQHTPEEQSAQNNKVPEEFSEPK